MSSRPVDEPHVKRLPIDSPYRNEILLAHQGALDAGEDGYVDPVTGYFVFTSAHLAQASKCCENGCRHCPFIE